MLRTASHKARGQRCQEEAVPYSAQTLDPDASLASKPGRPNVAVPVPPPQKGDDGEIIEQDDEFADFERGNTVVFSFVRHNRYEAVEALVEQDQQVLQAEDEYGNSLLHVACQNKNRRLAKLLLKNGISANIQNKRGNTPLHYCYQYGFTDLAEYLVSNGADDTVANEDGLVPHQGTGHAQDAMAGAQADLRSTR